MQVGIVKQIDINEEMQASYLSYAMSVIVARALPDARDGLKPVQRRILYAMHDMGLRPTTSHKKSARVVGEVLGKYHPHGDQSVYDAMARMAQDFSMRYELVDGQGNFGSVDGDSPAAMRYTEARLQHLSMQLLTDIQKETVDYTPNFDDTLLEPVVLPANLPNLLINGATGIAVGMSTSIPPHNLIEVCDALVYMLERWESLEDVQVADLMNFVKGPDFPTGGIIVTKEGEDTLLNAYGTGRGKVTVQAKIHVEEMGRGRNRLIVTELPYQTNKSSLIERIANMVRQGRVEGISDLRDESDRQGMRIVIELHSKIDPDEVIKRLFKITPLQSTFSIIMLALVNGEPRMLSLKQSLRVFVEHRLEIIRRRSEFDLAKAKARAHIVEGLLIALKNIDEVIKIIRNSPDTPTARERLMKKLKLSELQANAILDMPLKRIARLERKKLEEEYKELKGIINYLEKLLKSPKLMRDVITEELTTIKEEFGDARRTQIVTSSTGVLTRARDLVPSEDVWVVVTSDGGVGRLKPSGRMAVSKNAPLAVANANTRDVVYLFTADGRASAMPAHTITEITDLKDAPPWSSISAFSAEDEVVAVVALDGKVRIASTDEKDKPSKTGPYLALASNSGMVKKIHINDLPGPSSTDFKVMNISDGDQLIGARVIEEDSELMMVTAQGQGIRFKGKDVRHMGLTAGGVNGVKLGAKNDAVVAFDIVNPDSDILLVTSDGAGKRTPMSEYPTQGRYGKGVQAWKMSGSRYLTGATISTVKDYCVILTSKGQAKLLKLDKAPSRKRAQRGAEIHALWPQDTIMQVIGFAPRLEGPEPPPPPPEPKKEKKATKPKAKAKTKAKKKK